MEDYATTIFSWLFAIFSWPVCGLFAVCLRVSFAVRLRRFGDQFIVDKWIKYVIA
jgi:hypothetical protein